MKTDQDIIEARLMVDWLERELYEGTIDLDEYHRQVEAIIEGLKPKQGIKPPWTRTRFLTSPFMDLDRSDS